MCLMGANPLQVTLEDNNKWIGTYRPVLLSNTGNKKLDTEPIHSLVRVR